jgi:hypothetical protein
MRRRDVLIASSQAILAGCRATPGGTMLEIPISREKNSQFGVNKFEPEFLLKPRVVLRLHNPATGDSGKIEGFIDTGADACVIGAQLAAGIGLKPTGDPGIKIWGASGAIELKPALLEMEILGPDDAPDVHFGRKPTPFYLSPYVKKVILGVHGFLDQFTQVRLEYGKQRLTLVP